MSDLPRPETEDPKEIGGGKSSRSSARHLPLGPGRPRERKMLIGELAVAPFATASASGFPGTSPMELDALGRHNGACKSARTPWFGARCALEATGEFLQCRFFTTLSICVAVGVVLAFLG